MQSASRWVLHWPGFTLHPRLLMWRTSGMVVKMTRFSIRWHLLLGEFSRSQVPWAPSNPQTWNLASRGFQLNVFLIINIILNLFFFLILPSCPRCQPFQQIILSWVGILDWPVHFFTIVYTGLTTNFIISCQNLSVPDDPCLLYSCRCP